MDLFGSVLVSLSVILLGVFSAAAPNSAAFASVSGLISERQAHLEEFYKDLHENPELSGQETRTAGKVAGELRSMGYEVTENIGGHGLVGILRNGNGPVTLIRSELDALPVPEDTNVPFKSKNPGVMHACGHDFHATALVGAAYVMAHSRDEWKGTLVFLAQPAEETVKGADAMIKDGLFKRIPKPDQVLALHTSGKFKKGTIGVISGYALANADTIEVTFKGRGTHGSAPEFGIDPFIMAAEFTLKMQTLVGREKSALKPAVISVGSIHGGTKSNIIPDTVKMQLTMRTYDQKLRQHLMKRVVEVGKGIALTSGAPEPVFAFPESTDATFNDIKLTERMKSLYLQQLGKDAVIDADPIMGGEDFGQFGIAAKVPSMVFWVGERNEKDTTISNHSPRFLPDFQATAPIAIKSMVLALMDLHKK